MVIGRASWKTLALSLFFELGDEASADAIEAGQESAPEMLVAPEILAGFGVEDSEASIARRRDFVVIRDGVFGDVALIVDRAGLSTGEEDVAAFVRIGGKEED